MFENRWGWVIEGRYRWRTWLRPYTPWWMLRLGRFGKGEQNCGAHEWYPEDDDTDTCYHCIVGERMRMADADYPN